MNRKTLKSVAVALFAAVCLVIGVTWKPGSVTAVIGGNSIDGMVMYGINSVNGSLMRYDFGSGTLQHIATVRGERPSAIGY